MDEMLLGHRERLSEPETDGSRHILTFHFEDGRVETMEIGDGEVIIPEQLPAFDEDKYAYWKYEHNGRRVNEFLPVY